MSESTSTAIDEILIVDDTTANLELLTDILTQAGYKIRPASSGELALRSVKAKIPALILLDIKMPGMDGLEVCRQLKAAEKTRIIPVIFISVLEDERSKIKGFQAGAVDYLTKPFYPEEILARVKMHLSINRLQLKLERHNEQLLKEIAEREQAKEELRESEEKYRLLFETVIHGIQAIDSSGKIVSANSACHMMLGYKNGELVGRSLFEFIPDSYQQKKMSDNIQILLKKQLKPKPWFGKIKKKNGEIFNGQIDWNYKRNKNGEVIGFIFVFSDITERKKLEKELIKSQKLEATSILAGGIAHDFNNLLAVITGNIDMAMDDLGMNHRNADDLKEAFKACMKAQDLTKKFITFSSGGTPVRRKSSIKELLTESDEVVFSGTDCPTELSFGENLWQVEVDKGQMSQVFKNVLLNAKESMKEGGTVQIRAENISSLIDEDIVAETKADRRFVKIDITDQGTGISDQIMYNIFDPYFSTKDRGAQKGMGLGLTVASSIIKQHNGHMVIKSEENVGTSVYIYLPGLN